MGAHARLFAIMVVYTGRLIPEIRDRLPVFITLHAYIQRVLTDPDTSRIKEEDFPKILEATDHYLAMLREFRSAGVPEEVVNVFVECIKKPLSDRKRA